jgi:hypothetical protein
VAKKQGRQSQKRLVVSIRHVATPDGNVRVCRTIDILLKAAAEASSRQKTPQMVKRKRHAVRLLP